MKGLSRMMVAAGWALAAIGGRTAEEPLVALLAAASAPTNAPQSVARPPQSAALAAMPAGGWSWDELAKMAGARVDEAKILTIRAAAKRSAVDADLAWKDPQLRLAHAWEDSRERSTRESPANGDGGTYTAGVRFYVANPFINRYVRRAGDAEVEALEARAKTAQYAVYCEVKSLCLEEERLRREQLRRKEAGELWERMRLCLERRMAEGIVKSPLDVIQAEVAREKARAQAEEAFLARRQVRRQLAFYTGLSERGLQIRYTPPEPPGTNAAFAAVLAETALARRPDLVGARAELVAAQANVGAAKMAHLPWFDFVEGTYSHNASSERIWSGSTTPVRGRKRGFEDEWQVRVGITVPIFTWFGDAVKASRSLEEAHSVRVASLAESVRHEIESALDDFGVADRRFVRLSDTGRAFVKRMQARLDEFAATTAVKPDDICRAQLELLDYRKFKDEAEYEWVSRILLLETVSGGPLPYGAELKPVAEGKVAP